ncbi:MAG: phosphotransferase family protein [Acidimicrobiales bacterium]
MTDRTAALAAALAEVLSADRVTDVLRLSAGASRETWSFNADDRPLILQRGRGNESPAAATTMVTEAALINAARSCGAPVPVIVAAGDGADALERPWMVAERLEGETIPRKLLRDDEFASVRPRLAAQCGEALARIHGIDPADAPELPDVDQLAFWEDVHRQIDDPHPTFEFALRWLNRTRPASARHTVVHGDFRNGNLLIGPDRLRGVVDWELAHLGDPHEDLAWLCVRAWRFASSHPVGGFGSRDELVAAYEAVSGHEVDRDALQWWEVFGNLRWAIICQIQVQSHLMGIKSIEQAAIGRRVAEAEYDLLSALPGGRDLPGTITSLPALDTERGLHDRPTAAELLDAVRHFVSTDVAEATTGRTHHLTRVATNILSMVERQLALQSTLADRHRGRLHTFGVLDEAAWADAIASGHLDDRHDEVMSALFATTLDKLSVANPGYVEQQHRSPE